MNKTQSNQYAYIEGERGCYRNFRQENRAQPGGVREGILAELTPTLTLKSSNVLVECSPVRGKHIQTHRDTAAYSRNLSQSHGVVRTDSNLESGAENEWWLPSGAWHGTWCLTYIIWQMRKQWLKNVRTFLQGYFANYT